MVVDGISGVGQKVRILGDPGGTSMIGADKGSRRRLALTSEGRSRKLQRCQTEEEGRHQPRKAGSLQNQKAPVDFSLRTPGEEYSNALVLVTPGLGSWYPNIIMHLCSEATEFVGIWYNKQ